MSLVHSQFSANARIRNAALDAPAMHRGETDAAAVRLLQRGLVAVGAGRLPRSRAAGGGFDGDYGGETVEAVRRFQRQARTCGHFCEINGVAGGQVWSALDALAPDPMPATAVLTAAGGEIAPAETAETVDTGRDVALPSAAAMLATYQSYRHDQPGYRGRGGLPCHQAIANQCAVRMSIALGINARNFQLTAADCRFTHRADNRNCDLAAHHAYPHNAGAQRLFDYIGTVWTFTTYRGDGAAIQRSVTDRKGIVFFRDCGRAGNATGDHIDYWDGSHVMNDRLRYNARGELDPDGASDSRRWFANSRSVHFCPLPD